jgi:hypothetical protein
MGTYFDYICRDELAKRTAAAAAAAAGGTEKNEEL